MQVAQPGLNEALLRALDEALGMFGESVRGVVYYYCEVKYGAKREELWRPEKLEALADCVAEIFGAASRILEEQVLARLCEALNVDRASLPRGFKDALAYLATRYIARP